MQIVLGAERLLDCLGECLGLVRNAHQPAYAVRLDHVANGSGYDRTTGCQVLGGFGRTDESRCPVSSEWDQRSIPPGQVPREFSVWLRTEVVDIGASRQTP